MKKKVQFKKSRDQFGYFRYPWLGAVTKRPTKNLTKQFHFEILLIAEVTKATLETIAMKHLFLFLQLLFPLQHFLYFSGMVE